MATASSSAQLASELKGSKVLLTGITGFVGSELARQLLELGAHVRAPTRWPIDSPKLAELKRNYDGLPGDVTFVDADIRSEDALAAALDGVSYIFHVASPFVITSPNPAEDIVAPAVEGTAAMLRAAGRHKEHIKRVVVTSSVCAIHDCNAKQSPSSPSGRYTEADWNAVSTVEAEPYWVSKVEAERTAWRLAGELGLPLSTVLPNFVMGPVAAPQAASGISVGFFKGFVEASPGPDVKAPPSGVWTFADVRDVGRAHIAAAVVPAAAGRRYIVSARRSTSARTVTDILKARLPQLAGIPDGQSGDEAEMIDPSAVEADLGLKLTPVEDTLADMAASLLKHGVAVPRAAGAGADATAKVAVGQVEAKTEAGEKVEEGGAKA
ncbi:hypothetical protein HYH02_011487 [Chlamydomonas schloesseri]|uniref:Flavanone 4-reductase n=1 Tax=Chlamydomonas schloesseri TaxID=2026947 RepID=A0A835TEX0_9CHLO|nr:hypothetical protein HYH02_011487 [Chlamydomonas schloesseri]|eukprot:KAG2436550.1 hypothetical protein HYH02_011487 [Chlamydomonas schloesseri]